MCALQEASVMAMADGFAQATGRAALVNVHTGAGLGNAMGNLLTASLNKTPLIVTAGQQTREMLLMEPWLTNVEATTRPRPWVKWAYEPVHAEDTPPRSCARLPRPFSRLQVPCCFRSRSMIGKSRATGRR